jgi:hypothetical protein
LAASTITPNIAITNTSLLLNFTHAGIYDAAMLNNLETVGDTKISTTQSKFGGSSMFFDGTGDYLVTQSNSIFTFGTGDLTLECWIYQTATSTSTYRVIFGDNVYGSTGGYTLYSYNNALNLWKGGSGGVEVIAPAGTITLNAWNHVAWTRSGSSNRLFINGTQVGATTTDATNYTSTISYIGASQAGTFPFVGYIDDLRITKGLARYTANFTPPTAALPTINSTTPTPSVDYLVVAGGGGAPKNNYIGAGAGGAGYSYQTINPVAGVTYTITVGSGGTGATTMNSVGSNGTSSSVSGGAVNITTTGGYGDGLNSNASGNGNAAGTGSDYIGGGGGGAGAAAVGNGPGGNGILVTSGYFSNNSNYYGGGGGGGVANGNPAKPGGLGGGGASATPGTTNTGGGGGGGSVMASTNGGNGGSGTVIIRYLDAYSLPTATTGSPTLTMANGYIIYQFTSSGTITF